jgi:hypothetical protein
MFFGKRRLETPSRQFMPFAANGPYQPDLAARMRADRSLIMVYIRKTQIPKRKAA